MIFRKISEKNMFQCCVYIGACPFAQLHVHFSVYLCARLSDWLFTCPSIFLSFYLVIKPISLHFDDIPTLFSLSACSSVDISVNTLMVRLYKRLSVCPILCLTTRSLFCRFNYSVYLTILSIRLLICLTTSTHSSAC